MISLVISELGGIFCSFLLPNPALRHSHYDLCFSQSRNLFRDLGQSHCGGCLGREGIVFSHSLMGKAWALHTGDTKSAARDTLLDACLQQHPQLPAACLLLQCGRHKSGKDMQHHTKDFFNEDEFLRVTGGCGCCSGLFPSARSFPTHHSFLIH